MHVDELAGEGDGVGLQQGAKDRQVLLHPAAAGARVDAADLHLVAVVAPDADPEDEPAR